jgi:abequosyltransferase
MSTSPRLSIGIPTYNRAPFLRECLESVLDSAAEHLDQVEILVSDNASTDDTRALVTRFQERYPQIRYYRHAANIGGENNFYAAAQLVHGEYLWLLGDDDKLWPHAVPTVLHHLEQGYDFLVSNFSVWEHDFSTVKLKRVMPVHTDTVFNDPNRLLASFGVQLGYISAVVLKQSLFLAPPRADYDAFARYGLAFMYVVYASVFPRCRGLYLCDPLLCNRDNPRESDSDRWGRFFITGAQAVLARLQQLGYSAAAAHAAKDRLLRDYVLRTILGRVRDGQSAWPLLRLMYPGFKRHGFFWTACIPAALAPAPLLRLATRLVRERRARAQRIQGEPAA